jgi:hypothetical protein
MIPIILLGLLLVAAAGRRREIVLLLVVPAYYLIVHSVVSTEYRYILSIHYFLFVFAGAGLYGLAAVILSGIRSTERFVRNRVPREATAGPA